MTPTGQYQHDHMRLKGIPVMDKDNQLHETEAEVIAVIGQRITAVYDEIYPRYNKRTSDGVVLDVDWWLRQYPELERQKLLAAMTYRRKGPDQVGAPTSSDKGSIRSARSAIKKHPELAKELLSDPDTFQVVSEAIEEQKADVIEATTGIHPRRAPRTPEEKADHARRQEEADKIFEGLLQAAGDLALLSDPATTMRNLRQFVALAVQTKADWRDEWTKSMRADWEVIDQDLTILQMRDAMKGME